MFDSLVQKLIPFKNLSKQEKKLIEQRRYEENRARRTGCRGCFSYGLIIFIALCLIVFFVNMID